jgi:outer membrane lipoprotein-sorting protein
MRNDQFDFENCDQTDSKLETVLQSIREERVPDSPEPTMDLRASIEKVSSEKSSGVGTILTPRGKRSRWFSVLGIAAAFVVMVFLVWPDSRQSAFARMQAALKDVRTVSYTVLDYHADGNTWETKAWIVEPDFVRSEQLKVGEGLVSNGVQISDGSRNLRLHIDNKTKTATFFEINPSEEMAARRNQFTERLRSVSEHATKDLGATTFDGKPAHAFLMTFGTGGRQFRVTVDNESTLPVQMEFLDVKTGFREVFTNFVFDHDIDMNLFALEAPEGFAVKRIALTDPPTNTDLLVVSPKTGVGPVAFGENADAVIDFLGEPSSNRVFAPTAPPGSKQKPQGFEYLQYNSMGLEIGVNSEYGMTLIRCLSQATTGPTVHNFAGRTTEGICIGSTVNQVKEAYGEPELVSKESHSYLRLGWTFSIREGKVIGIEVNEPIPDEIEIIVNEDGSVRQQVR